MKTRKQGRKSRASAPRTGHARTARRSRSRPAAAPRQRSAPHSHGPSHQAALPTPVTVIAGPPPAPAFPKDDYDYSWLHDFLGKGIAPGPCRAVVFGCKQGEAAVYLSERGYRVTGLDSDRAAIGLARERAWLSGCEIDFMIGDFFETANLLPAESFGLAMDRSVFRALPNERDRRRYLETVHRLMLPSGVFMLAATEVDMPKRRQPRRTTRKEALLVQEGGEMVGEVLRSGFDIAGRHLYPAGDRRGGEKERGELLLYCRK